MVNLDLIRPVIEEFLSATDGFLVELKADAENNITVTFDSPTGVDLEACEALNRKLQEVLDQTPYADDYSLEVGSAGLSAPLTVRGQFEKFMGEKVAVLTRDGRKVRGTLESLEPEGSDGDIAFAVKTVQRVKEPGQKRPHDVETVLPFRLSEVNRVEYDF